MAAKSFVFGFLRFEKLGSVARDGRSGGIAGDLAATAATGALSGPGGGGLEPMAGAGGRIEPGAGTTAAGLAAAQGPGDCSTTGLSAAGGGGRTLSGDTMTLFTGSWAPIMGFAGAWLAWPAVRAVALTSACVPPPWSARISDGDSEPAPEKGASSSSQHGRKAVASRSKSSGVKGALSSNPDPLGGLPG
jgi:hypothetical protein